MSAGGEGDREGWSKVDKNKTKGKSVEMCLRIATWVILFKSK